MPRLSLQATATTTTELQLKPAVKQKLLTKLKEYSGLAREAAALKVKMSEKNTAIEGILGEIGESQVDIDGYKGTIVAGVSRKLNKKKLSPKARAEVEAAMEEKPKKSYVKVTAPGEKERNYDDD